MVRAAVAVLLLGLCLYCAHAAGVQGSDSSRRTLQQDQFDDAPDEQDVSAYLAALAAAAGVSLEDLQFDSSLDEKAPKVQLPQQPTPTLLRLISKMANARGNPAYTGHGQPGPNFPGFGVNRPSSFGAVGSAAAFDAVTGGFGLPGSNQPYQLPERFRHYLDSDPLQLPSLPEPQQQHQQQQGYTPESAQMSSQQQQQQEQQGVTTPQLSSLITKLSGRGRKFGTSPGGVSHEMLHASIPRLESAPIGPPSLDATTQQQLVQQPGLLTVGTRLEGVNYGADAATEQLLAELEGLDPVLAKQQFQKLLNKVGGRSASVSEVTTRKPYVPREKAAPLAPGRSEFADSSDSASTAGALQQLGERQQQQQQQELMDGRDGHSAYGRIVTDNVVLADLHEIDREAAAALAGQPVEVDLLQVDPATFAALERETPQTFGEIQDEAAAVATAAAAAGTSVSSSSRSKQLPALQQQDSTHIDDKVIAPAGLASHLMPGAESLASGNNRSNQKGLPAGAATGIALGAFGAVLLGAGVLLFVQARKMDQDRDSGYTPTALTEDMELANQKVPAVCISPAVSMGGAAMSSGGAAADVVRPDRRLTLNGGAEAAAGSFGEPSSGSTGGWIRDLTGRGASGNAAAAAPGRTPAAASFRLTAEGILAAPVARPAAAGDIRRFTLTSE